MKVSVDDDVLRNSKECLIAAIDQGTSSTRFLAFSNKGEVAASAQMEHRQIFPTGEDRVGWHEHDPIEIWKNTIACVEAVVENLKSVNLQKYPFKTVGITNQRETTIAWNAKTGKPYYNAIVWDDVRTEKTSHQIAKGNIDRLREKTGLPIASYFAGTRVKWLLNNCESLRKDLEDPEMREHVRFGTIDTWLIYQLTGQKSTEEGAANVGGKFITDVTNASRWLFLDLHKVEWDQDLVDDICAPHSVPLTALPTIKPSCAIHVEVSSTCGIDNLKNVTIGAVLGDQQAALFGQCAFEPGEAKNTYGTGLFLIMNTGQKMVKSSHGLITTIAYQIGEKDHVIYGLEGSVSHSGSTLQWLRDQLKMITSFSEPEALAPEHNDGLYLVPAFAGLFAPHWRADARGCIVGLTATHHRGHICRAALEAPAYQTREVFDAIYADSKVALKSLKVDGGGTASSLMMQFQADMIGVDVVKPAVQETTALGVAFGAGLAVGVYKNIEEVRKLWTIGETWKPKMSKENVEKNWHGWRKAVKRSLGWNENSEDFIQDGENGEETKDASTDKSKYFPLITLLFTSTVALVTGIIIGSKRR